MKVYLSNENRLIDGSDEFLTAALVENVLWIDLLSPNKEEIKKVEDFLSIKIPTQEEMKEIESSSSLYKENNILVMTIIAVKRENGDSKTVNLTFLLKHNALVTLRYDDIAPLSLFLKTGRTNPAFTLGSSVSMLLGMLEAFIEKIADHLESVSGTIEQLSQRIFSEKKEQNKDLSKALITMGLQGGINSLTRDSLSSISRMIDYLKFNIDFVEAERYQSRFQTLALDAANLKDYSSFLEHRIGFILDSSLGLINIEQNNIIKIFSIAAVVLLPPTLIASIYGMNFHFMPETKWAYGYPYALALIILSAILPYLYIKWKGWL